MWVWSILCLVIPPYFSGVCGPRSQLQTRRDFPALGQKRLFLLGIVWDFIFSHRSLPCFVAKATSLLKDLRNSNTPCSVPQFPRTGLFTFLINPFFVYQRKLFINILQLQLSAQPVDLLQSPWDGNCVARHCLRALPGAAVLYVSRDLYHNENTLHFVCVLENSIRMLRFPALAIYFFELAKIPPYDT